MDMQEAGAKNRSRAVRLGVGSPADAARGLRRLGAPFATGKQSGRPDLNRGPLVPQTSALTRLRHAPPAADVTATGVSGSFRRGDWCIFAH